MITGHVDVAATDVDTDGLDPRDFRMIAPDIHRATAWFEKRGKEPPVDGGFLR